MKSLFIVLAAMVSLSANAQVGKPRKLYDCVTNTDPDSLSVDIMSAYGKTYAVLFEESCDGDCGAEDIVEVKRIDTGNDSVVTYAQTPNKNAQYPGMQVKKPSRKTRGLAIRIKAFGDKTGAVKGVSDPLGSKLPQTELECKAIISAI